MEQDKCFLRGLLSLHYFSNEFSPRTDNEEVKQTTEGKFWKFKIIVA